MNKLRPYDLTCARAFIDVFYVISGSYIFIFVGKKLVFRGYHQGYRGNISITLGYRCPSYESDPLIKTRSHCKNDLFCPFCCAVNRQLL